MKNAEDRVIIDPAEGEMHRK